MSPAYRGRVISVETDLVTAMRGQNHVWAAQAVIIIWSFFAGFGMIAGASRYR